MSPNPRIDPCRTCLSTEGEMISLFSETCNVSCIKKKIMSIVDVPIDKDDGLPDKICRKCIYLLESFYCFKNQLISADKRLRNVCTGEDEEIGERVSRDASTPGESKEVLHDELNFDIKWISDDERKKVEKAFRRKWAREDKKKLRETRVAKKNIEIQVSLPVEITENEPQKSGKPADVIEDDIRKSGEPEDIKNDTVESKEPRDIIKSDTVKFEESNVIVGEDIRKSDTLEYIVKDNIFKPDESKEIEHISVKSDKRKDIEENSIESKEPKDIKDDSVKSDEPKNIEENSAKSEKAKVSVDDEAIDSQNADYAVKQEFIQTDRLSNALQSQKSEDLRRTSEIEKKTEEEEEKEDPNIIVISDSSDEADSSNRPRGALTTIPTDSSGATDNGAYTITIHSPTYPNGRAIITIPASPSRGKNVARSEKKKKSPCREAASAEKTSANSSPRRFFQCTRCNVNLFTVAAVLLHHNQIHTPNKASLCCRMCDKTFPAKSNLFEHFNQHIESHLFRCSFCPNEFVMKKNLVEHLKIHKKRVGVAETKSSNKRVKVSLVNSLEVSREAKQHAKKKRDSSISPKDSDDSGKENIDTGDTLMLMAQNLRQNPVKMAEEENDVVTARPAAPVVQIHDENCMEQEEEIIGN